MAVDLGKLIAEVKENVDFPELRNKRLAIDAYNTIYQFISIIRQPDGTPLVDSKNRITSHLSGLFYRTINLVEQGIVPIFIFDGIPPAMKRRTLEARMSHRKEEYEEWQKAKAKGMLEEAKLHAMASSRINKEIVDSSKQLLERMGIAYIQAPSEGEAQAAKMVKEGLVYAAGSQDYDLFLFGSDVVIRNLTITGKRKLPGKNIYIDILVERIFLKKLLENLGITRKKLVWLGMLLGTDFNSGIDGVGPKTALKIVKEHDGLDSIKKYVAEKYKKEFEVEPEEVERIFLEPDVIDIEKNWIDERIKEARPNKQEIVKFMCEEHDFSEERIGKFADKLLEIKSGAGQKGINSWM